MVHAPLQSVTPTVTQDHVAQSNATLFPQQSNYVRQQVCWNFFNLSKETISLTYADIDIALRPILRARRYWPGSFHPSTRTTTSCINSCFSTSDCSRKCVHAPLATTPCLPRCTSTLSRPPTAMAYANSNVDFPSARRLQPPPRSFKCSLAHPN